MKKQKNRKEAEGSITVFLSLILLLILSLFFTIIEGARISTAKAYARRALTTAMDSVLADYYGPLWEEYHIFGTDTGRTKFVTWEENTVYQMEEYMSHTFSPGKDKQDKDKNNVDLFRVSVDNLSIRKDSMLMDYQGKLFANQTIEYMKYQELGNILEQLLDKMKGINPTKKR